MKYFVLILFYCFSFYSYAQDTLNLVFVGDIMQHQGQIDAAKRGTNYEYDENFLLIKKHIDSADLAIANLEVTLAGKPYSGYPQFCAPDELATALKNSGFDILLTANNHSCDKAKKGVVRTLDVLDSLNIGHTGTFYSQEDRDSLYPLLVEQNNFRLAILNYTYGTNGIPAPAPTIVNLIDTVQIATDIINAKAMNPDVIIANMHWGEEYKLKPNKEQKTLADFLIRQGVQLIIGSHPHVLQHMEKRYSSDSIAENVVIYSLGNFVSNMRAKNTEGGVIANIRLIKENEKLIIDECGYRFVWVYKPVIEKQRHFYILPIAEFEDNPDYFETIADYNKMINFVKDMRNLYDAENIGFIEYK